MSAKLTPADLADLAAVKRGGSHPDGSPRYIRASELGDGGARLIALGLAKNAGVSVVLTVAGCVEAKARGL